jgi:hypothetical protein
MNILPKFKKCPACDNVNIIKVNGSTCKNNFLSLSEWILKKVFNCRKCKVELGFFLNNSNKKKKLVWIDHFKCEDKYFNQLTKLQTAKEKYKKQNKIFFKTTKEIEDIQNKIRLDQVKVIVKCKIQNRGLLIRHVY